MSPCCWRCAALLLAAGFPATPAHAFLGIADTSFVTVIANPAEAANWAAELDRLNSEIAAAQGTLGIVGQLRAYAGDPRAALAGAGDLGAVAGPLAQLTSGSRTAADLQAQWQALGAGQQAAATATVLRTAGAGPTMAVFGQAAGRDSAAYAAAAADSSVAGQMRTQIAAEQSARGAVAAGLTDAWTRFRTATTESEKQAILTEISQLESQSAVMDERRRAMLDDLALSDRQERTSAQVRSQATDETLLAESSLLNAAVSDRARAAEDQRLATLQKTSAAARPPDYSGMRLWTTADAGGPPP